MTVVVGFLRLGTSEIVTLDRSPRIVVGSEQGKRLKLPTIIPGNDASQRGTALMKLLTSHKPVRAALDEALASPVTDPPQPLYFKVAAKTADALPWEQLYTSAHGFCALDRRWPVGRIVGRYHGVPDRAFIPPLRIVALLSAAKVSGIAQLNGILAAVATPEARKLGVSLTVISAEPAVLAAVEASKVKGVRAEQLKTDAAAVAAQITAAEPHILHVLCHGGLSFGLRTLALATTADFLADDDDEFSDPGAAAPQGGSVRLPAPSLAQALEPVNPWLVVLAACDTAEVADGPGLAQDLVEAGVPAVIGMRRLVDLTDTDVFSGALYPELIRTVTEVLEAREGASAREVVDWASALTAPRVALSGTDPLAQDTWSDPVLYVQSDPLRVYWDGAAKLSPVEFTRLKAQLDVWRAQRSALDEASTDKSLLRKIDAKIADLSKQLMASLS
ncbi:MAG: CHAT domain-containing protein [Cellulomonas sp.]